MFCGNIVNVKLTIIPCSNPTTFKLLNDTLGSCDTICLASSSTNDEGGVKNSKHLVGKASDISVKGLTPLEVYNTIERLIKNGDMLQGGLGLYDTFVHYDIRHFLVLALSKYDS